MYTSIALPIFLSFLASTSALPTLYEPSAIVARVPSAAQLLPRAATAPPACAAKAGGKRDVSSIAKRIAQADLPAVAQSWQDLCNQSQGGDKSSNPCVSLAGQRGIAALLANGDTCDQQHVADDMITFAKGVTNNKDALIANAIAYRKHPRNALVLAGGGLPPSTLFCQEEPKNAELKGVVNTQLDGVDPGLFGSPKIAPVAFGAPGTCPLGETANAQTCECK